MNSRRPVHADVLVVTGGNRLRGGSVDIPGFKHSLVTVFAAALAVPGNVTISNCPDIEETEVLRSLVEQMGGTAKYARQSLGLNTAMCIGPPFDRVEASRAHGSLYLVPALLARFG